MVAPFIETERHPHHLSRRSKIRGPLHRNLDDLNAQLDFIGRNESSTSWGRPSQIHTAHLATPLELKFFLIRIARRWPPEPPRLRGALDIGMFQINRFDHPRCAFAQLLRRQALFFDQTANRRRTDFQRNCSFVQSDLSTLGALALSVGRDGVLVAQAANADTGPTVARPVDLLARLRTAAVVLSGI